MGKLIFFPLFIKQLKMMMYLMKDKKAPKRYKAMVILGIVYLLSPIDLIPAPILGFSVIDDIVVLSFIMNYLKNPLSAYSDQYDADKARKADLKGKKIIDDVEYTVKDDNEEKDKK